MKLLKFFILVLGVLVISFVYASNPEFSLSDTQGKEHKLSDYKGKWVVVNYWATWCPPCVKEIPELIALNEKYKAADIVVLGVNYEDISEQKVADFIVEFAINYPILLSEPDVYSPLGKIIGLPTTFIISPDGQVVHKKTGSVDAAYLENAIAGYRHTLGKTAQ